MANKNNLLSSILLTLIHEVKTKETMTVEAFGYLCCYFLVSFSVLVSIEQSY